MSSKLTVDTVTERCGTCNEATPHLARLELRVESEVATNAQYSREPYRISECTVCGESRTQRMNNA